jgi:RNA polymerase sigma-70 factor (ECF subfamily)
LRTAYRVCGHAFRDLRRRDRGVGGSALIEKLNEIPFDDGRGQSGRDWQRWAYCWAAGLVQQEVEAVTWNAFRLAAVEGVSAADTARQLGMKVGSVYTAKCRILARIRELVHELSRSDARRSASRKTARTFSQD